MAKGTTPQQASDKGDPVASSLNKAAKYVEIIVQTNRNLTEANDNLHQALEVRDAREVTKDRAWGAALNAAERRIRYADATSTIAIGLSCALSLIVIVALAWGSL